MEKGAHVCLIQQFEFIFSFEIFYFKMRVIDVFDAKIKSEVRIWESDIGR